MNVVQATEFCALIVGIGAAGTVIYKGGRMARRFGHFIDKLAGNGDTEPGVLARLESLKKDGASLMERGDVRDTKLQEIKDALDEHVNREVPAWRQEGMDWGQRLEAGIQGVADRITALETRVGALEASVTKS